MNCIIVAETGEEIIVSQTDFDFINVNYKLYVDKRGYVVTKKRNRNKSILSGKLHRILMNPPKGKFIHIDHEDGNKLNNTRENLRKCSHLENMRNRKTNEGYAGKELVSQYKGVTFEKKRNVWIVKVGDGKGSVTYHGSFNNEIAAANCYNYHAEKVYGEFFKSNGCLYMPKEEWSKYIVKKTISSTYRGVSKDKTNQEWLSQLWNGERNIVRRLDTEIEAALFYDVMAKLIKGDKAKLNFT